MTIKGYAKWAASTAACVPLWTLGAVALGVRALVNPVKFFRRVDRSGMPPFPDPVPGVVHASIEVDGVRLHAATHGLDTDRPLLVMLHGFPEAWFSWRHQVAAFAGEYALVALDMRGYGGSDAPAGVRAYWMDRLVGDVAAAVAAAGRASCTLLAHDWGGAVAWAAAAARPGLVDRLVVLCSPHPRAYADPARFDAAQARRSWYFGLFRARGLPEAWLRCRDFEAVDAVFASARRAGAFSPADVARYKAALARRGALTAAVNYYRAAADNTSRHPVPELAAALERRLAMPVLLLYADADAAFLPQMFHGYEAFIDDLTLVELRDCSHWAQQDRPDEVNAAIHAFFERTARCAAGAAAEAAAAAAAPQAQPPCADESEGDAVAQWAAEGGGLPPAAKGAPAVHVQAYAGRAARC